MSEIKCKNCGYKGSFNGLQQHLRNKKICYASYSMDEINEFNETKKERRKISKHAKNQKQMKRKSSKVHFFSHFFGRT